MAPPSPSALAAERGGVVTSVDDRDVVRFVWATDAVPAAETDDVEAAALSYLERFAPAFAVGADALAAVEVRRVNELPRIGTVVRFGQRYAGIEVYPSEARVLMRRDGSLVAITASMTSETAKAPQFGLSAQAALAIAIADSTGALVTAASMSAPRDGHGDFLRFDARTDEVHLPEPARVKRVLWNGRDGLRPAYFVEAYAGRPERRDSYAYRHVIDAKDGRILDVEDLTSADAFAYRVYADPVDQRPFDGPHTDFSPHPTGMPDGSMPMPLGSSVVTIESFNTPPGSATDPWLPSGATETLGNNVDAYADITAPSGFNGGDLRASTTGTNVFDRSIDLNQAPNWNDGQIMAAITNIFYTINWLHDYWYDSGFDEAAGNAQADNYGRGGLGGDVLRAEIQDHGGRNNANMSTPSDGLSPRMQVYVWNGDSSASVTLAGATSPTQIGTASFGPQNFSVTGSIVEVDDGNNIVTDACEPLTNNVAGNIVLVDRGLCSFILKVQNAEAAGATGVILVNNRAGNPPGMSGTGTTNIPVLSISDVDGAAIRTALAAGAVTATMNRTVSPDLDGALDVGLVSHEWGHYIHRRLTSCGNVQCSAMSEGWGDTIDFFTKIREGDDMMGAYGHTVYAASGRTNGEYFGTRRTAYSSNPAINAQSFRHIQAGEPLPTGQPLRINGRPNSQIHNAGEIWASMMFDMYTSLLTQVGPSGPSFDDIRRRYADYVVAGLLLTPRAGTYIEGRDAILAAVFAATQNPQDLELVGNAFAGRGAGTCAEGPGQDSTDLVGVVEDFATQARILAGPLTLDDGFYSCDDDGVLDAQERGRVSFTVSNGGPAPMTGAVVTLTSTTPGVVFPDGARIPLPTIDPFQTETIELPVDIDPAQVAYGTLTLVTTIEAANTCELTRTSTVISLVNFDSLPGSASDDVEAPTSAWTPSGDDADQIWAMTPTANTRAWIGVDFGAPSDTSIESPTLEVSTSTVFIVTLSHRYRFEQTSEDFDGGMIELTTDGGRNWRDVSNWVDPGYTGTLGTSSNNPLGGRDVYAGESPAWPDREPLTLDFGSQLAGRTVQLRFRIGTDAAVSNFGWEIDDIDVQGIDNAPFTVLTDDGTNCPPELVADAGPDQTVDALGLVLLDGSGSVSNAGRTLGYTWSQTAGPTVTIERGDTELAGFVAPNLAQEATLTFELLVDDGSITATDTVDVVVRMGTFVELVADAGPDETVAPGDFVLLDGSASRGEGTLTYAWAQLDGPTIALEGTGAAVTFAAPTVETESTATFELTVTDDNGTATDTVQITITAAEAIVADAGADQNTIGGTTVVLDATRSTGPGPLTFAWEQTAGTDVALGSGDAPVILFEAPNIDEALTFRVTVSDGERTATDEVTVTVKPATTPPTDDGGCSCATTEDRTSGAWAWLWPMIALVLRRRR